MTTPTKPYAPAFLNSHSKNNISQIFAKILGPLVLLGPAGLWLLFLLVLPTLVIFELSLVENIRPGDLVNPDGIGNYLRVFESLNLKVIWRSIYFATGTTILCLLLGFPVAYWIALMSPKQWRNILLLGFILPLWTSSFISSLGDFVDPELLGGASSMTAARLIYNQFLGATQNWGFGSSLSMVLILGVSIAIALLLKFGDGRPSK